MQVKKIAQLYNTLKYLRGQQLYYLLYYRLRNKFIKPDYFYSAKKTSASNITFEHGIDQQRSFFGQNVFSFLNLQHSFNENIDWNYNQYGKLWTYNLNYFDYLNQSDMSAEQGLLLIKDYLLNDKVLKDGKEPYPISLRGINWIKFLSKYKIDDAEIRHGLFNHYQILFNSIEYHLLGNHLLENGFSLLFAGYYFQNIDFTKKGLSILTAELAEQTLKDGAHFELSPMYHQIILYRLLDCYNLVKNNSCKGAEQAQSLIEEHSVKMLGWLQAITYNNGDIPMLNDSSYGIAPGSGSIFEYAKSLHLNWIQSVLKESGYRKWNTEKYELVMDVGNIGPDYIPGHAHADTFNFELKINNKPFIVDTGISTYEKNKRRQFERSTIAHNTVVINDLDQSGVWSGFRVAERAKITFLNEEKDSIESAHDGYLKYGVIHSRAFEKSLAEISIFDKVISKSTNTAKALLHFHPDLKQIAIKDNALSFENGVEIVFEYAESIKKNEYMFCEGYNILRAACYIEVVFKDKLNTIIKL